MARTRTWKVCVASAKPVAEIVSERRVGTHGLVVIWRVIRTGELIEQRYVRRADRWQRYEDWCRERGRTPVPARLATDSVVDEPWISWRGDHSVRWFV